MSVRKHTTGAAVALALSATLLTGCLSQSAKPQQDSAKARAERATTPDWITQLPQRNGMAYGVGSMEIYGSVTDAIKRAGDLARVDLVSQLRVTVSGDFSVDTQERSGTGRASEVQQNVRNYVRSQVPDVQLDEVQITETHSDGKYAYALAELDRAQAAARLRRQIGEIDEELRRIGAQQPQGSTLQQLQPLLPALKQFALRDKTSEQLALISTSRSGLALDDDLRALQQRISGLLDQLTVALVALDAGADAVAGGVLEALTQQGLRVENRASADLVFEVSATLSSKAQGGSHYVFADTRVTVRDAGGRALSSFSKQARGVSGLPDVARQTATRNVAALLGDELAVALVDKLR